MPPHPTTARRRGVRRWIALGAVGLALAITFGIEARHASSTAEHEAQVADEVELLQWRARLHEAHLDEVNALLRGFYQAGRPDLDVARQARFDVRDDAETAFARIAQGDGATAVEARALLDLLTQDSVGDDELADAVDLNDTGWAAVSEALPSPATLTEEERQLFDVVDLGVSASLVLNDAFDAAFAATHPRPTPRLAEYLRHSEPSIRTEAGYYGPDPTHPLADSDVYDPTATLPLALVDEVDLLLADGHLWAYDAWNRSWRNGPNGPPPLPLDALADEARTTDAAIRTRLDATFETSHSRHRDAADDQAARALVLWLAAAVLALVPLGAALALGTRHLRTIRATAALVATDRLTGAGNRHALHDRTAALLADPAMTSHLVAMIDLDRFKMVNDSWGHAVGDAVLCEIADALAAIVAERAWHGGEGTVIRLGGDEFLLTLHSSRPIARNEVQRRLDAIRARWIEPRPGEHLPLAFSVGIVTAEGPCSVDDVVRAADLASYDDKAARAVGFAERRLPAAPPLPAPAATSD